jgi:hypothetical protein
MANEITLNLSWTLTKSNHKDSFQPGTKSITQTGVGAHCPVVSVGTSEEDLTVGDISTLGWLTLQNLDATNYVQWGPKSGGAMVAVGRLKPGEIAHLRLEPGITLRWIANTGACKVLVKLLED